MNKKRVEFATEVFLASMRSEAVKANPDAQVTVMKLTDYPEAHRSALMKSIEKSIRSSDPSKDEQFQNWLSRNKAHSNT